MSNENPNKQKLKDRLYAELNASSTETDEFKAAFRYVQELENEEIPDPELKQLEKDALKMKIEKERAEIKKLETPEKEDNFFSKHASVLIPAAGTFAGVVVIVCAEVFGTAILNSKAMNRLPKP